MAVVYSVMCDTRDEAEQAMARLCELLGLEPSGPPSEVIGRDRWMGRARPATPATDQPEH
ncbi:hypothetical protein ABZX65_26780 [Streptomyces sp. NPDC003300]|uniref:hypothetical protein n=1 Tax=unclassified Streptomyces TaxID=2593676 RepID=UPI0033B024C4